MDTLTCSYCVAADRFQAPFDIRLTFDLIAHKLLRTLARW